MKLRRYFGLGARHFGILCRAFVVVLAVRLILTFVKYRKIAQWITLQSPAAEPSSSPYVIAWAVKHTSRIVPFASCLTQALALQFMLARRGHTSAIRVGVKNDQASSFRAHAWVIWDDTVLIGGTEEDIASFTPMVDLRPS